MNRSEPVNGPVVRSRAVTVPDAVWGRLASAADDRGVTIEDILVTAIENVIAPGTVEEQIVQLARAGHPDRVIADMTGELLQRVGIVRRRARIPANKFRGTRVGASRP